MNTKFLAIDRNEPDTLVINKAGRIIKSGGLVAFPTETVYGLGADALNPDAVSRIYEAKGRPSDNPLILHVDTLALAENLVDMNSTARKLALTFWPGPLTLVLPAKSCVPEITRGGLETAAVRMPDNLIARMLIYASETPIAAPSANLSGRPSPTNAESVYYDMNGKIDMILDGGSVRVGIESTVIDVTDPGHVLLLRPGGTSRQDIERVINTELYVPDSKSAKRSPGTHYKHYAPSIPVRIWRRNSGEDDTSLSCVNSGTDGEVATTCVNSGTESEVATTCVRGGRVRSAPPLRKGRPGEVAYIYSCTSRGRERSFISPCVNSGIEGEAADYVYLGIHEPPFQTAKTILFTDYADYAHELFASFRRLEREGYTGIIVEWPEEDSGICEGLRDRILRAAYV